ncbi:MBL fold metallo-hydrolase [Balneolaceae bacterium ANBcel3]|nr:MBL fold metallo-hydrolase [Balneolaceae bacterium ANBcel3]
MSRRVHIVILADNSTDPSVENKGWISEHGLSFWVEYGDKNILFDTGQTDSVVHNAARAGIDLSKTDAIVLSHGHYDHTGGLPYVLKEAQKAKVFVHPSAMGEKYSLKNDQPRFIGMGEEVRQRLGQQEIHWTETPFQFVPGITVTGEIPRSHSFEDTGGAFYTDPACKTEDFLPDDQALFIEAENRRIILMGCAHAGLVNTLDYIEHLAGRKKSCLLLGGLHLLHADETRLRTTIDAMKSHNIHMVVPLHCTGVQATEALKEAFGKCCLTGGVGFSFTLSM